MSSGTVENVSTVDGRIMERKGSDLKGRVMFFVKLLVSAGLIYYLVSSANLAQIWHSVQSANLPLLFVAFLLHAIGYSSSSWRWQLLLRDQNYDVSFFYLLRSYAVAMFFNNFLPSTIGGDGYRALDLTKRGIPKGKAVAIVIVERFLGLFALMIFAILAFSLATSMIAQTENLWIWAVSIFTGMLAIVWMLFFRSGELVLLQKVFSLPGLSLVAKFANKIGEAFAPFKGRTKVLGWTMGISLVFQLNVILHFYLISQALGLGIPFSYFLAFIPISILIQTLPVSINGIGVREGIYISFLTEMLGKATVEQSIAFSWIAYGMILLLGILGGVIYAFRK